MTIGYVLTPSQPVFLCVIILYTKLPLGEEHQWVLPYVKDQVQQTGTVKSLVPAHHREQKQTVKHAKLSLSTTVL